MCNICNILFELDLSLQNTAPPPLGGNAFYKIMHFETIQIVFNLGPNEQKFQKALNCDQVNEL